MCLWQTIYMFLREGENKGERESEKKARERERSCVGYELYTPLFSLFNNGAERYSRPVKVKFVCSP